MIDYIQIYNPISSFQYYFPPSPSEQLFIYNLQQNHITKITFCQKNIQTHRKPNFSEPTLWQVRLKEWKCIGMNIYDIFGQYPCEQKEKQKGKQIINLKRKSKNFVNHTEKHISFLLASNLLVRFSKNYNNKSFLNVYLPTFILQPKIECKNFTYVKRPQFSFPYLKKTRSHVFSNILQSYSAKHKPHFSLGRMIKQFSPSELWPFFNTFQQQAGRKICIFDGKIMVLGEKISELHRIICCH